MKNDAEAEIETETETEIEGCLIQWDEVVKLNDGTFNFYFFCNGNGIYGVNAVSKEAAEMEIGLRIKIDRVMVGE